MRSKCAWADAALVLIALIWGSTFVVVKEALRDVSTLLFLAIRFALAGVLLTLVLRRRLPGIRPKYTLQAGLVAGIFLFSGYALQTFGLNYTTPSKSGFLTGLSIVIVPALAAFLERRPPRAMEWLGVLSAFTGMALMTLPGWSLSMNVGDMLTVGCALMFALHILVLGHVAARAGLELLSLVQIATAAALAGGSFWWAEPYFVRWTVPVVAAIVATAVLATALAFWLQTWAQQRTTPTRTALILALEPVFAWLTSFLLEGEVLSLRASAGAGLILSGVLLVELKPGMRGREKEAQPHATYNSE